MKDVDQRIVEMLEAEAIEKRIAATIVLGELRIKGPEVVEALARALESGAPTLAKHALEALSRIGAKKVAERVLPFLVSSSDPELRRAAMECLASVGEELLPMIRERMQRATPEERQALDGVLAQLGGKEAFHTLLDGLSSTDLESAKVAAVTVRQRVKSADAATRKTYLSETEKYLKRQKDSGRVAAVAAAIKILGYLEDERAVPTLLSYAVDRDAPPPVKLEALIALRFALARTSDAPKVVSALLDAATDADRSVAQTALHTLGNLELSGEHVSKLLKLVEHPDLERARMVIDQLGRQGGKEAAKVLTKILVGADKRRAELAAQALGQLEDAAPALGKALLETTDPDRAWMIKSILKSSAKKLSPAARKQMLEQAIERLKDGEAGWEASLEVVREADPEGVATALRELAQKMKKAKHAEKAAAIYALLCRSDEATDDDRYARAVLELAKGGHDNRPAARAGNEALKQLKILTDRGFDVAQSLRAEKSLGLEELFFVGFHFSELRDPLGTELLGEVVKKGGRAKIAKMAKNKLNLATAAE